jgi:hypothetical protein
MVWRRSNLPRRPECRRGRSSRKRRERLLTQSTHPSICTADAEYSERVVRCRAKTEPVMQVAFTVNGKPVKVEIEPAPGVAKTIRLLDKLSEKLWRVTWRGSTCRAPVLKFDGGRIGASCLMQKRL